MSRFRIMKERSLRLCPETCPAVEGAISDWIRDNAGIMPPDLIKRMAELESSVKQAGTYPLRAALDSACDQLIDAEERIAELEAERVRLLNQIDILVTE